MPRTLSTSGKPAATVGGFLLLILSGALLGSAFYVEWMSFLGFLLVAPLIVYASRAGSYGYAALGGYAYGVAYLFIAHAWVIESYSARWTSLEAPSASGSLAAVIAVTVGLSALLFGIFAALVRYFHVRFGASVSFALLSALLYAALEYLRLPLFALITLGPGGTDEFYTSGFLGYLASGFPGLRLLGVVAEVYGLSFVLALVNAGIAAGLLREGGARLRVLSGVTLATAFLGGLTLSLAPVSATTATVLGLATAVPGGMPEEVRETAARNVLVSRAGDLARADLVVFPETYGMSVATTLAGAPPLLASRRIDKGETATFIGAVFEEGRTPSYAEKRILVPYGEYVPYLVRFVGSIVDKEQTEALVRSLNAVPGKREGRVYEAGGLFPGILFCNEAWAPAAAARLKAEGARIAVVVASHASFEKPSLLEAFEERVLSIRAASLRMPVVQVTNRGRSYVVSASGEMLARYGVGETFLAEVPLPEAP